MSSDFIMDQKLANWRDLRQQPTVRNLHDLCCIYLILQLTMVSLLKTPIALGIAFGIAAVLILVLRVAKIGG